MDTFQHFQKIAREQGYLPEWLQLQKKIREQLQIVTTKKELKDVNHLIKKYNKVCPIPMQRFPIAFSYLEEAKKKF